MAPGGTSRTPHPRRRPSATAWPRPAATSFAKVGCGDPSARFEVLAKLENKTMVDASLDACADVPKATSSYWEGKSGEVGLVLCLAPVEPVAAPKK